MNSFTKAEHRSFAAESVLYGQLCRKRLTNNKYYCAGGLDSTSSKAENSEYSPLIEVEVSRSDDEYAYFCA